MTAENNTIESEHVRIISRFLPYLCLVNRRENDKTNNIKNSEGPQQQAYY